MRRKWWVASVLLAMASLSTMARSTPPAVGARPISPVATTDRFLFGYLGQWSCRVPEGGPLGMAIDDSDHVYALTGARVFVYTNAGALVSQWGSAGEDSGQFCFPTGVAVGGDDLVYVTSSCRGRVARFTLAGTLVDEWASSVPGEQEPLSPAAIGIDDSGYVYVVDPWFSRVVKFTADGVYRMQWVVEGAAEGEFSWLSGIACDHRGRVYVADYYRPRLQVFTTSGDHLADWPVTGYGLAVDAEEHLYVVDQAGGQIVELDTSGVELRRWGSRGRGDGQFVDANCATVDRDGNVFVGEQVGRVQKFGMATRWLIAATPGPNGEIGPAPEVFVAEGMDQAYTIVPAPGYCVSTVSIDGIPIGSPSAYRFESVVADHTIEASFAPLFGWTHDANLNLPVCKAPYAQVAPLIVPDGATGAIVAWSSYGENSRSDVLAQHVNALGLPRWDSSGQRVRVTPNAQYLRRLLPDGSGGAFVLVWDAVSSSSNDRDLFVQRLDASGVAQWGDSGVAICPAPSNQSGADMIPDGSGGVIVAWNDFKGGPPDSIRIQRVDAAGVPVWGSEGVLVAVKNGTHQPALVSDGAGGAILFWSDYRAQQPRHLFAQRVDSEGVPLWTPQGLRVSENYPNQDYCAAVSDGAGGAIVVMISMASGACSEYTSCAHIIAQHLDSVGARLWGPYGVTVCATAGSEDVPQVVSDGAGGAIVAWDDHRDGSDWSDVYASRIRASGALDWSGDGVAIGAEPGTQRGLVLVPDGSGGAVLAWVDERPGAYEIRAQRVSSSGITRWAPGGVALCTAAYERFDPAIASDGAGGAIVTWSDYRSVGPYIYDADIYAQQVDRDGLVGGRRPAGVAGPGTPALSLERALPNPLCDGALQLRFSLATTEAATLELLDVSGRRVASREVGGLGPGRHSIALADGGVLAPGVYFVRLSQGKERRTTRAVVLH